MPSDWDDDEDDYADHWGGAQDDESNADSGLDALSFGEPAEEPVEDDDANWTGLGDAFTPEPESDLDAFADYTVAQIAADNANASSGIDGGEEDEDEEGRRLILFTVTHPSQSITVQALISGAIRHVELEPSVSRMTERELTEAIMLTAELAGMKGRAAQYSLAKELMEYQGVDSNMVEDFLEESVRLPTPAQAEAAETAVNSQYLRGEL